MKRLVLLGGGHAHLAVLQQMIDNPQARAPTTLVAPEPRLLYSGMVPGVVAGHYTAAEATIDVAALAARAGAHVIPVHATAIRPDRREVECADGRALVYDVLSIDVGSRPLGEEIPGVERHAVRVRPLDRLVAGWSETLAAARAGGVSAITVVGAGAAGVEVALAMDHALRAALGPDAAHVRIVTNATSALGEFSSGARTRLQRHLARRNIGLHLGNGVVEVGAAHVRLEGGLEFASDRTFWATGPAPPAFLGASGLATDERGFVLVDAFQRSLSHGEVFAAGDCATRSDRPLPRAGVFAVRAGPALAHNLQAAVAGGDLAAHATSPRYLALVSTGGRHAVGIWNGLAWEGDWVWRWKDRIDRRWVQRFRA